MTRKHRRVVTIMAVGLAVALLLGMAGLALAQGAGGSTTLGDILSRVAARLGIQESDLQGAIVQVEKEMLDEAVQAGKLPQDRADAIKKRLDEGKMGPFPFLAGAREGWHRGWKGGHRGWKGDHRGSMPKFNGLADFLGISTEDLRAALSSGKSLAQIAQEKGKSREDLKSFLAEPAVNRLDEAVKAGKLDQEKADQIKAKTLERIEQWIDRAGKAQPGK